MPTKRCIDKRELRVACCLAGSKPPPDISTPSDFSQSVGASSLILTHSSVQPRFRSLECAVLIPDDWSASSREPSRVATYDFRMRTRGLFEKIAWRLIVVAKPGTSEIIVADKTVLRFSVAFFSSSIITSKLLRTVAWSRVAAKFSRSCDAT